MAVKTWSVAAEVFEKGRGGFFGIPSLLFVPQCGYKPSPKLVLVECSFVIFFV